MSEYEELFDEDALEEEFFDEDENPQTDEEIPEDDGENEDEEDVRPVIDVHAHIGHWSADNVDFTEDVLQEAFDEPFEVEAGGKNELNEVQFVLVSNMNGIDTLPDSTPSEDEIEANEKMLEICRNNPKFKAMIVGQPGHGDASNLAALLDEYYDEIFGIKLHPNTLLLKANDPLYEPYMEVAEHYNMPVLFHSQDNWSDPLYIYETAMKFPDVPVVMAHLGMGDDLNHARAFGILQTAVASGTANLFADVSWLSAGFIVRMLKEADDEVVSRLLWGTDIPLGPFGNASYYPARVAEVQEAICQSFDEDEAEELIHMLFFQNAFDLFFDGRFE